MITEEASQQETIDFIAHIKDPAMAGIFDVEYCKLYKTPYSFYKDGTLLSLQNLSVSPPFTMDYFQSGDLTVYIDGSTEPFDMLNKTGNLELNRNTVVDYLEFYCKCVNQRPKNILLLRNPDDMPFQDTVFIDFHFDKNNYGEKDIYVRRNEFNDGFIIEAPFVFAGKIDLGVAQVSNEGHVEIERAHHR